MADGRMVGRFTVVEGAEGEVHALFAAATRAAVALAATSGVATAKAWFGFPFREDSGDGSPPDLRLAGVSALAADRELLAEVWATATAALGSGVARYDVEGEVAKAAGTGWGVEIPTSGVEPLGHDEPVLVVISGDLYAEHLGAFATAGGPVVAQAHAHPGYLGGCGLVSPAMVDITSFSCWRSARDARRFAFGAGAHRAAIAADQAGGWHDQSTNVFLSLRVLEATGSVLGSTPFVGAA